MNFPGRPSGETLIASAPFGRPSTGTCGSPTQAPSCAPPRTLPPSTCSTASRFVTSTRTTCVSGGRTATTTTSWRPSQGRLETRRPTSIGSGSMSKRRALALAVSFGVTRVSFLRRFRAIPTTITSSTCSMIGKSTIRPLKPPCDSSKVRSQRLPVQTSLFPWPHAAF